MLHPVERKRQAIRILFSLFLNSEHEMNEKSLAFALCNVCFMGKYDRADTELYHAGFELRNELKPA